jgi:Bacterial membrane protein YfhO
MDHSTSGRRWAVGALLFLTIAAFYWKLTLTRQFTWTRGPDLAEQVLPWFDLQAREWHAGRIPLWDPFVWVGQPLIGQAQPGVAYPLNWLLFALPLSDGHISPIALNWYYVIIHFMAAAFAYLFCRDMGRSRPASFAAGLLFALSGYLGATDWPQMMNGAVWIPLVFLFQFRALRAHRTIASAALSGMFLGIAFLSGHHQIPMFTTVAWALVWLWHLARDRRLLPAAALAVAILALTSALQTLPAYEYGHLARRWVGAPEPLEWNQPVPYSVHEHYDLKPFSLFGLVFPEAHLNFDPFIGVTGLTLALLAIAAYWDDRRVRLLALLGLGALVYSLGHNSVFQGLLYAITPDLDKARTPSAIVVLMQFAAAALAAFAVDHLREDPPDPWLRRARLGLLGFGVVTVSLCFFTILSNHFTFPVDDRIILTAFIALFLAAILLRPAAAPIPLILLLIFELGNYGQISLLDLSDRNRMQWLDKLYGNRDLADYLRRQPGFPRTEIAGDLFAPNWGAWNNLEMRGGKLASVTYNVLDSDFFGLTAFRMWGVAYTVADKPDERYGPEVFTAASGLKLYRRPDAFPRAWAVHELVPVKSLEESNLHISSEPEAYRRKATITAPAPKLESCSGEDRVELIEHFADRLTIRADLACTGMVVLSDAFYPGWRARLDHRLTPIHEVNGAMRGVIVPQGSHTITMRYRPMTVYLGAALSLLGILGALALQKL